MELFGIQTGYNPMSKQGLPHREPNKIAGTSPVNVGSWERIGSAMLGGYLMYRAVKNRNWFALLSGSTGATLLNRGLSGYCPVYGRMGMSSTSKISL
jgi:hypothetical protein